VLVLALVLGLPALALALGAFERRYGRPRPRTRRETALDVTCWFAVPAITAVSTELAGIESAVAPWGFASAVRSQPLVLQAVEALVLSDLVGYATHRLFHVRPLARLHALHHSARETDWLVSARMHPLNDILSSWARIAVLAFIGFEMSSLAMLLPVVWFHLVFIHTSAPLSYGPLRWLLVSPAYHAFHHVRGDRNFASIFPWIDALFGTAAMPEPAPATPWRVAPRNATESS
jgi:sterol desaturase/sphingolipid hydroxylase (fatty acid hydroxylase superfamily)